MMDKPKNNWVAFSFSDARSSPPGIPAEQVWRIVSTPASKKRVWPESGNHLAERKVAVSAKTQLDVEKQFHGFRLKLIAAEIGLGTRRYVMKQMKHWQDPVNAVLGAWLILSPWVLGF